MDHCEDCKCEYIRSIVEELKTKGKGKNIDNICELSHTKFGWSNEQTSIALKFAVSHNIVQEYTYRNKESYKIRDDDN